VVLVDGRRTGEPSSVLTQCMLGVDYVNSSLPNEHNRQRRTCFTATVAELDSGQAIQLQDISIADSDEGPFFLDGNTANYFGIFAL